jgi:hypothetical protein
MCTHINLTDLDFQEYLRMPISILVAISSQLLINYMCQYALAYTNKSRPHPLFLSRLTKPTFFLRSQQWHAPSHVKSIFWPSSNNCGTKRYYREWHWWIWLSTWNSYQNEHHGLISHDWHAHLKANFNITITNMKWL